MLIGMHSSIQVRMNQSQGNAAEAAEVQQELDKLQVSLCKCANLLVHMSGRLLPPDVLHYVPAISPMYR